MDAFQLWKRGWDRFYDPKQESRKGNDDARNDFLEAIKLAPSFSLAYAKLSYTYVREWENDWGDWVDKPEEERREGRRRALDEALKYAQMATTLDNSQSDNHYNLAIVYSTMGRFEAALSEYAISRSLNPNNTHMLAYMGETLIQMGRSEDAVAQVTEQIDSAKQSGQTVPYWYFQTRARAYYMLKNYKAALIDINEIVKLGDFPYDVSLLRAVCLCADQHGVISQEVQEEMKKFTDAEPNWRLEDSQRYQWANDLDKEHWRKGLEDAGMPI